MDAADEAALRDRLRNDYPAFAEACLRIRTKGAAIRPLRLNRVQLHIHGLAQEQIRNCGMVRAIVLKGRQQGVSTYVEGRAYHRTIHNFGYRTFILTHHAEATANLFNMTKRYHDLSPPPFKPVLGASSQRELAFPKLDSGFKVGTAGTEGVGRSDTIQFFHGSEVAFWPNADDHAAGALQAVPRAPNTEVWLESTALGIGNFFHQTWQAAEAGMNDYMPVFIPWFLDDDYRITPADTDRFLADLADEDVDYMQAYELTADQMAWRSFKIAELGDLKFRQEYPATPAEAFQVTGPDSYISNQIILRARKCKPTPHMAYGARILGVDVGWKSDRTSFYRRQGCVAEHRGSWIGRDPMEVTALIIEEWRAAEAAGEPYDMTFIDVGGIGAGVVARLRELNFTKFMGVNFGEGADNPQRYPNKRCEMWGRTKEWLAGPEPVSISDRDALHGDLAAPRWEPDTKSRDKLETKKEMVKRGLRSPDEGDALALTFAFHVSASDNALASDRYRRKKKSGNWMGV